MAAKRYRRFGHRSGTWAVAMLIMGACATGAQAQVQFSAWPMCNEGLNPFGLASFGIEPLAGIEGFGLFQPVPPKSEPWELSRICFGAAFVDTDGQELPTANLPNSGWVVGYLGVPPLVGESPGTPVFLLFVGMSPSDSLDTGFTGPTGATIRRVCVSIPTELIAANETLSVSVVANLDPTVGSMFIFNSNLLDPLVHDAWLMDFNLDQNVFDGIFSTCDDIAAYELFGPNSVPAASTWGLIAMTLLILTGGTLVFRSRMAKPVAG